MLTPEDRQLLIAAVGNDIVDAEAFPKGFLDEYAIRLGMIKRMGVASPGLGPAMLVDLVRQFQMTDTRDTSETYQGVTNWRNVPHDSVILVDGRRARFKGILGDGRLEILLDGYRGKHEVAMSQCVLAKPRVKDVPDKDFVQEPLTAKQAALVDQEKQSDESEKQYLDPTFAAWNAVDPGTIVRFRNDSGEEVTGGFMDVDDDRIALEVDGELVRISPSQVIEEAEATA